MTHIGASVTFDGDLTCDEDLTIETIGTISASEDRYTMPPLSPIGTAFNPRDMEAQCRPQVCLPRP